MGAPPSSKAEPTIKANVARARPQGKVVALTGAASFLGTNLVGVLEEDPRIGRIVAIDVKTPVTASRKTRMYDVDLTTPMAEERVAEILAAESVEVLVHAGFLAAPIHATAWAHELESVGTMHVLNAARQVGLSKLILWSQTSLYGALPSNPNFLTEKHPLRADANEPYFADKIQAEREVHAFASKAKNTVVTVLRTAPIVGPTVNNVATRYLAQHAVFTLLGFDPLWQFVHEVDAIAAFKLAIDRDVPGTFNIVGDGVLPLSKIIRLAGRINVPVLHPLAESIVGGLWATHLSIAPASFLPYLRYVCVADGEHASMVLGFRPIYSTREALLDFVSAQKLRDVRLLQELPI